MKRLTSVWYKLPEKLPEHNQSVLIMTRMGIFEHAVYNAESKQFVNQYFEVVYSSPMWWTDLESIREMLRSEGS